MRTGLSFFKGSLHCKKELAIFPSPAGMSLTKLSGWEKTKLFPPRKSLISDIPAGDGKTANSFLQCSHDDLKKICLEIFMPRLKVLGYEKHQYFHISGYSWLDSSLYYSKT